MPSVSVADLIAGHRDELARATAEQIRQEVAGYRQLDPEATADMVTSIAANHDVLHRLLLRGGEIAPDDLDYIRIPVTRRQRAGIPLDDFLAALRIELRAIWDAVLAEAGDDEPARSQALELARPIIEFTNVLSTVATAAYTEAAEAAAAEGDRLRRDLLENLLGGRPPVAASLAAAHDAGLDGPAGLVVVVAVHPADVDADVRRTATFALARAAAGVLRPLAVARQDEIVLVVGLQGTTPTRIASTLTEARDRLAASTVALRVGISTVHAGLAEVVDAYREARAAAEATTALTALAELGPVDYLALLPDATVLRLITPRVVAFVREQLRGKGDLLDTLKAFAAADMSLTATAAAIDVHVNTVRHRLSRIAELTGHDPRNFAGLFELAVAVRVVQARVEDL